MSNEATFRDWRLLVDNMRNILLTTFNDLDSHPHALSRAIQAWMLSNF